MQLSVIIVNYNVKHFLEQCLQSVLLATKNITSEIFVVDNNSTDGSKTYFENNFTQVQFIWLNENVGFAKANNIAVAKATGEYILFLNPDTIIAEDCLEKVIAFAKSTEAVGAVGVKMIDGSGRFLKESKRAFPSPSISLFKILGLATLFPTSSTFAKYHLGHLSSNQIHEVDVLAGAFMLIPQTILNKVGSFDEDFFMYGEDVDLSYRIQKAGYKNYYFAQTTIIHFKGESTKKGSLNYVRLFYKAMNQFVHKHYKGTNAAFFTFLINTGIHLRAAVAAVSSIFKINKESSLKNKANLVVSDEKNYNAVVDILTQHNETVLGRVNVFSNDTRNTISDINNIQSLLKNDTAIIFCQNHLSIGKIIEWVEQLPKEIVKRFYLAETKSIVSSHNKDNRGDSIGL
ncbi:MAG: glycosyltransferase family 2 protein [Ferruginibacter sp.]|nr:glycosyltransferase family 2 protein [Ferruginibacter sp.]